MIFNHMIHSPCYKGVMLYTVCLHSITIIIIMTRLMTTLLVTLARLRSAQVNTKMNHCSIKSYFVNNETR